MNWVYYIQQKDEPKLWLKSYEQHGNILTNCQWVGRMEDAKMFEDIMIARFISNILGNTEVAKVVR